VWGAGEQVNVGCVGIGGKGASDVTGAAGAGGNIIALCDVGEEKGEEKGTFYFSVAGIGFVW